MERRLSESEAQRTQRLVAGQQQDANRRSSETESQRFAVNQQ